MLIRRLQFALLLFVGAFAFAETLDRVVVVVDKGVILASQWEEAVRYEALLEGKDLSAITPADREHTLDRLIDQELLRQQMTGTTYQPATPAEIDAKAADVRRQVRPGADDAQWRATLAKYGLDEEDVRERVEQQVNLLRFVEVRFRPSIHVDPRAVEAYYKNTFVPQVRAAGQQPPPLQQAKAGIEELLVQQRIDDLLSAYLKNLRAQSHIRRVDAPAPKELR
jgi:parvulin-like peptidyl-prolyl isomerase